MKFFTKIIVVLSLGFLAANSTFAAVISNGSSGELRPTSDFTLDLSGSTVPQFSSVFVDTGIRLTILTPAGGSFGNLLAANDIFVNGIIDAGSGNLGFLAGNQIALGTGSQVIAGSLNLSALTISVLGTIPVSADVNVNPGTGLPGGIGGQPINPRPTGPVVPFPPSGPITPVPAPSTFLLLLPGLALLAGRRTWRREGV